MADNAGRNRHAWAIAGAFAAQAGILIGTGVLQGGTVTAPAAPAPAAQAPGTVTLLPYITPQHVQQAPVFSYTLSMDGQRGSGVFMGDRPAPAYTVEPGQDLRITLSVAIPATLNITGLSVSLASTTQMGQDVTVYDDAAQPLAPGLHTFKLDLAGSAGDLQPGTTWSLYLAAGSADGSYDGSPVASVTAGS
jgi:hypothetical protein